MKKIIIIGAGPTGLAAAHRLSEQQYTHFTVYEQQAYAGGLCASFCDSQGFVWDLGGHVIFSHYDYFNALLDSLLGNDFVQHTRSAWVRTRNLWIAYPFQNHIAQLPKPLFRECIEGLRQTQKHPKSKRNFQEWILTHLGEGIAKYFMFPYNKKVWAYPLSSMSTTWMNERVSEVDADSLISQTSRKPAQNPWGPNAFFRYPLKGGTGVIFCNLAQRLQKNISFNTAVERIDTSKKIVYLNNGKQDSYDALINTMPLPLLIKRFVQKKESLRNASDDLKHNGVFIIGLGMKQPSPSQKCWMYFPDDDCPFFRTTYLSNYSPHNTPDASCNYSLLCESAYSAYKPETSTTITEKTTNGLINQGLLHERDRNDIVSRFLFDITYAYPIPTLDRNAALRTIQTSLESMQIFSRGRFGAWRYETANTDHCVMQGKEVADRILSKQPETVWSL